MTTVNGSNLYGTAPITKKAENSHPVRNTAIGVTAGAIGGYTGGYALAQIKGVPDSFINEKLIEEYNARYLKSSQSSRKEFLSKLKLMADDFTRTPEGKVKEQLKKNYRTDVRQLKKFYSRSEELFKLNCPAIKKEIENSYKSLKCVKFAAIGAAVVGAIALAGTLLSGKQEPEKKA